MWPGLRLKVKTNKRLQDDLLSRKGKGLEHRPDELRPAKRTRSTDAAAPSAASERSSRTARTRTALESAPEPAPAAAPAAAPAPAAAKQRRKRGEASAGDEHHSAGDAHPVTDVADDPPLAEQQAMPAPAAMPGAVEKLTSTLEGFVSQFAAQSSAMSSSVGSSELQSPMYRAGLQSAPTAETELKVVQEKLKSKIEDGEAQQRVSGANVHSFSLHAGRAACSSVRASVISC